jgi:Uri superfamily endonuclease
MRGTYTIIVESRSEGYRNIGRLGKARLQKGKYLYTGSAMGTGSTSLERRLQRHKARSKKKRWHIDYLTTRPDCKVSGAVYVVSKRRLECKANRFVAKHLKLGPVLPKIGASDCDCEGHLLGPELSLSKVALLKLLTNVYCRLTRNDPAVQVVQMDCASSHRFWNASRKILIKPWFFV